MKQPVERRLVAILAADVARYSRQAGPVRPVYNTDQPITALKGTGIRTVGPSRENVA